MLDWPDLDTEIITAGLTNDASRPPQLIINGNARHNWRIAYSWTDKTNPIGQYRLLSGSLTCLTRL